MDKQTKIWSSELRSGVMEAQRQILETTQQEDVYTWKVQESISSLKTLSRHTTSCLLKLHPILKGKKF